MIDLKTMYPNGLTLADALAHVPEQARQRFAPAATPRPRSLTALAPLPPLLNPDLLPPPLRPWIEDATERLGVPLAAVLAPVLVGVGALIGSTKRMQPKQLDPDWIESPNLWGMAVAASGLRKTPALNLALRPIRDIEKATVAEFEKDRHKREAKRTILERQVRALQNASSKSAKTATSTSLTDEERLADLYKELAKVPKEPPRIVTTDVTQERLGTLIEDNPRGILQVRDEMSGLLNTMAHRDGHEGYRSFLMEGYSSGAWHTVDRMSRVTTMIDPFTVSFFALVQPSILASHISSLNRTEGGDGFFARIQIVTSVHKDQVVRGVNRTDDVVAKTRANATLRAINDAALASLTSNPRGHYRLVRFDPDAQEHFDRWSEDIESQVKDLEGSAFSAYLAKSAGTAARLATILHEIDDAASNTTTVLVTLDQAQRATDLMDFFARHASLLYEGNNSPHAVLARGIAQKIENGTIVDGMKVSEVANKFDAKARRSTKDVRAALDLLAENDWLTIEEVPNASGPKSTIVRLSPWFTNNNSMPTAPIKS